MRTLVVVPAFNEEKNIPLVIEDLGKHGKEADVLVVNDGSTDGTSGAARRGGVRVADLPVNLGIGGAVQTGFRYARMEGYDIVVQFDGDGQHRADQLGIVLKPIIDGEADVAVGSRFLSGEGCEGYKTSLWRHAGIRLFSVVLSVLTGLRITDATSGFRAYGKRAVELFSKHYPEDYPEVEAFIILYRNRMRVKEVPVLMKKRLWGESSITPPRAVYYMVKVMLAVLLGTFGRRKSGKAGSS
jgi:glycosyltransferase involved in cell wall biosynthesis